MKKSLLFLLAASAVMASCNKDGNEAGGPAAGPVLINPVLNFSRASETNFDEGDRIGLTVLKTDGTKYAENQLMTFRDGVFSGNLQWYAEANDMSTLTAYYPYDEAGAPTEFSVATDQTDQTTGYGASDLIAGSKADVLPTAQAVVVPFKHLLTKLLVNVTNESGSDIRSVVLGGSVPKATVDLAALAATVDGSASAAEITAQQVTANKQYRAIVVPQEVAFTLTVSTADDRTLSQNLASANLKAGGQYTVDVRVLPDDIQVTLSGEITGWTDEGAIGPAEEVAFEEHLDENYFLYDGERYTTVKLSNGQYWMAEPMRYIPRGITPSTDPVADSHMWYPYKLNNADGSENTINAASATALTGADDIRKNGYFYDMYAALGGVEVTEENCNDFEGVQGICPKGWHIPTRTELWNLCGLSNKAASGESGNQINEEALFYDQNYGGGNMAKFNEAGWNYVVSGVRMMTNFAAEPKYQLTQFYSGNTSKSELFGTPAMTYIMSSTCYTPLYQDKEDPSKLTNIQFFSMMTTFTTKYPEGRINVAYISTKSGQQLRCVRDSQ